MRALSLNSLWLALARVGAQVLSVAFSVLLARRLGEAGFGQYVWLAALVAIGNAATTFGTDTLIIRELARDDRTTPALLGAVIWLQLALSVLWLSVVWVWSGPGLLLWFSLALLPLSVYTPFSAALRAHERMDQFLWLNLVVAVLPVLAVWLFVYARADLPKLAWALLAAQMGGALMVAWLCARAVPRFAVTWAWDGTVLAAVVRAALPLALLMAAAMVYQRLGVLMLTALTDDAFTGLYSAAARVVEGLKLGHYALLGALLPLASRTPQSLAARRAPWVLLGLSLGVAIIATISAAPLITLLFGVRYSSAAEVLRVVVWTLVPYSLSAYLSVQFVARNTEYWLLLGMVLALVAALA
ncbi:MAG: oligosaccharide flippase family protein, partial [Anaerolineales bacterium]